MSAPSMQTSKRMWLRPVATPSHPLPWQLGICVPGFPTEIIGGTNKPPVDSMACYSIVTHRGTICIFYWIKRFLCHISTATRSRRSSVDLLKPSTTMWYDHQIGRYKRAAFYPDPRRPGGRQGRRPAD